MERGETDCSSLPAVVKIDPLLMWRVSLAATEHCREITVNALRGEEVLLMSDRHYEEKFAA